MQRPYIKPYKTTPAQKQQRRRRRERHERASVMDERWDVSAEIHVSFDQFDVTRRTRRNDSRVALFVVTVADAALNALHPPCFAAASGFSCVAAGRDVNLNSCG